ncbi:uncharacterized protein LOC129600984 [Paramacrobiotus metropolitanus]|uniref:uncharacterized protein LOC129600984 n=1 Tax=Paramacrobiotus metropolitanus TaxID=2943436 RepID=UPI002445D1A7|nr:uncharacterized protein LOC129600984 [Paramacrobiotus metropolitanus]
MNIIFFLPTALFTNIELIKLQRTKMSVCTRRTRPRLGQWSGCSWCLSLLLQMCEGFPAPSGSLPPISSGRMSRRAGSPDLNDMLAQAMVNSRQDDRIVLPQLTASHDALDSVVVRPRLGEDATFQCEVLPGMDWRDVVWLHENRIVFKSGRLLPLPVEDISGQAYNYSRINHTLSLHILNVTMRSGGSVQCITAAPGSDWRVLQRFMLLPLITDHRDVFFYEEHDTPYLNVTEGKHVAVPCTVRLPLPERIHRNLHNHMIWRLNGRIIVGPEEAPYGPLLSTPKLAATTRRAPPPNRPGLLASFVFNFRAIRLNDTGEVQCLFRPHQDIHEWIIHTRALWVFPENDLPW